MDFYTAFATDEVAEVSGVWTKGPSGSEFLIARAQNRKYQRLLAKQIEDNQELLNTRSDEADQRSEELMAEIYAETILLGWKGTVPFNGSQMPYSKENAKKMCLLKEFRKWVQKKSDDIDAYRVKAEDEAKNV